MHLPPFGKLKHPIPSTQQHIFYGAKQCLARAEDVEDNQRKRRVSSQRSKRMHFRPKDKQKSSKGALADGSQLDKKIKPTQKSPALESSTCQSVLLRQPKVQQVRLLERIQPSQTAKQT
jgi:hypothetical protein